MKGANTGRRRRAIISSTMTPIRGSLAPFLDPASVAVIGASRDPFKVGGAVVANLRSASFPGRIVPVNSRASTVQGLPSAPRLQDVEGAVDLAVIAVPAVDVLSALVQCVAKGVGGAVVISAGFRETGGEGARREAELRAWLRGQPIRVLGPNCLGWIRPARRLNVTFASGMPEPGGIAFLSHSGAVAVAILDWARDGRVGFSLFASLGNQADVNESDLLDAGAANPETRVIAGYIEGVDNGPRFLDALRRAAAVKPVVLLKAGRSAEGARAVASHTGALAGSDRAFDAAARQAGALRVETVAELFDVARGLASQPLPRGRRLVVVTNGGGLGIVATDAARAAGFTMEPPAEPLRRRLAEGLPPMAGLANPVDLVGDADARRDAGMVDPGGGRLRGRRAGGARGAHARGGRHSLLRVSRARGQDAGRHGAARRAAAGGREPVRRLRRRDRRPSLACRERRRAGAPARHARASLPARRVRHRVHRRPPRQRRRRRDPRRQGADAGRRA